MIIVEKNAKELIIPDGIGNVNIINDTVVDGITREEVQHMIDSAVIEAGAVTPEIVTQEGDNARAYADAKDNELREDINRDFARKGEIPSTDTYATKDELRAVEDKIPDTTNFATKNEVQAVKNSIPSLNGYATQTYVNGKISDVEKKIPSLNGYATQNFVLNETAKVEAKIPNLGNYYTKTQVDDKLADKPSNQDVENKIEEALNSRSFKTINGESILGTGNIHIEGGEGGGGMTPEETQSMIDGSLDDYYDKTEIDGKLSGFNASIQEAIDENNQNYYTQEEVDDLLDDTLIDYYTQQETDVEIQEAIDAQDFKTINGENIRGKGDITIKTTLNNAGNSLVPVYVENGIVKPVKTIYGLTDTIEFKNFVPFVRSDGVMDIGKYIDFYNNTDNRTGRYLRIYRDDADRLKMRGGSQTNFNKDEYLVGSVQPVTLWRGTQSEYDSLLSIDDNTLYIIIR